MTQLLLTSYHTSLPSKGQTQSTVFSSPNCFLSLWGEEESSHILSSSPSSRAFYEVRLVSLTTCPELSFPFFTLTTLHVWCVFPTRPNAPWRQSHSVATLSLVPSTVLAHTGCQIKYLSTKHIATHISFTKQVEECHIRCCRGSSSPSKGLNTQHPAYPPI